MSRVRRAVSVAVLLGAASACHDGGVRREQMVAGGDPARGRSLIPEYGCGSCHVIPGVPGAEGKVGPPLTHFAERSFIAGNLRNEPTALAHWIRFPDHVEPGTAMPNLGVTEAHARDIAAYLYTLGSGGLGPPSLFPSNTIPAH